MVEYVRCCDAARQYRVARDDTGNLGMSVPERSGIEIASLYVLHFFFFSSRRRHTRYIGDWSSDVCSSDLPPTRVTIARLIRANSNQGGHVKVSRKAAAVIAGVGIAAVALFAASVGSASPARSEERRVGKEWRSRGWAYQEKKKWRESRGDG